jgi:hypothetical protein
MALEVLVSFEKGCFLTERKSVCEREREREREEGRRGPTTRSAESALSSGTPLGRQAHGLVPASRGDRERSGTLRCGSFAKVEKSALTEELPFSK